MTIDTTEFTDLPHIDRIKWKQINWNPESPDQYPDGLPPDKEEAMIIALPSSNSVIAVMAKQFSQEIYIYKALSDSGMIDMAAPSTEFVAAIPADIARRVFDALIELHRTATHGDVALMRGIDNIVFKPRKPIRATRNFLALLKPGQDKYGDREGIFFRFDPAEDTITMYLAVAESLDAFEELCAHNAWSDPDLADAVLTIPVGTVPEVAFAILKVHRRTREHDYQGADAGLGNSSAAV